MSTERSTKKSGLISAIIGAALASVRSRQRAADQHTTEHTPVKLSWNDWKSVLAGTKDAMSDKNLPALAAGVAYYSTLAFFPFLAAMVAIAALLISQQQIDDLVSVTEAYLPSDISSVIAGQLQNLVNRRSDNFLAAAVALAVALFGASGAIKSSINAGNVIYGARESRGWLAQQFWGIIWTVAGMIFGTIILALLAVNQTVLGHLGINQVVIEALLSGRWLLLLLLSICGLAIFYRYGPDRPRVRWQWVAWGAAIATIAWLAATALFFVYVQNFANYTQSYSLFAGIIVLMIWMNLSALIVLLGAEINHQLERVGHKKWGGFSWRND